MRGSRTSCVSPVVRRSTPPRWCCCCRESVRNRNPVLSRRRSVQHHCSAQRVRPPRCIQALVESGRYASPQFSLIAKPLRVRRVRVIADVVLTRPLVRVASEWRELTRAQDDGRADSGPRGVVLTPVSVRLVEALLFHRVTVAISQLNPCTQIDQEPFYACGWWPAAPPVWHIVRRRCSALPFGSPGVGCFGRYNIVVVERLCEGATRQINFKVSVREQRKGRHQSGTRALLRSQTAAEPMCRR